VTCAPLRPASWVHRGASSSESPQFRAVAVNGQSCFGGGGVLGMDGGAPVRGILQNVVVGMALRPWMTTALRVAKQDSGSGVPGTSQHVLGLRRGRRRVHSHVGVSGRFGRNFISHR
jgi:hypothetical protein